jgi:ribonuclease HII
MLKTTKRPKTAGLDYETVYLHHGFRHIVGVDEAGRGAWAGPVAAGAVCLPITDSRLSDILVGVRDSKQLSARQRSRLVETIKATAIVWGVGSASSTEIDQVGIVEATRQAMRRALEMLLMQNPGFTPDYLLTDYIRWIEPPLACPYQPIKKGDQHSLTIAAASILAKTWRDEHMRELETAYSGYEFARHKGYGTAKHQAALRTHGATNIHRRTFAPIRDLDQA